MNGSVVMSSPDDTSLSLSDRLRIDYQQTTDFIRTLHRLPLQALRARPDLERRSGGALVGHPDSAVELLALGLLGLAATLGILLYELRNSQLYDYATRRAQQIEAMLELPSLRGDGPGGLYREHPESGLRLFGLATVNRDRGLALVYSAAIAGWTYLLAWGALRAAHVGNSRPVGAMVGLAVGLILFAELVRVHERPDAKFAAPVTEAAPAER